MRNVAAILFSLLVAASVFGQQQKNEFSVFLTDSNIGYSSNRGTFGSTSYGLAFDRTLTPRLSAQVSIGFERHHTYNYFVTPGGGFQQITPLAFHTHPIDLAVRYHFLNDTRWKPYLGLGARYVRQPNVGSEFRYQNHLGPEIVGGTAFQFTRSFGLVLDGKLYLGDREHYDAQFKPSFGLLWRF